MSLDQYLNSENIKKATKPVDALQLTAEDQDIVKSETVEITKFDDPNLDEVIELHVYDSNGEYITSDHQADHWKHFSNDKSFIQYHLYQNLNDLGINHGTYKVALNFFRNLVGDDNNSNLYIRDISADRTELRCLIADNNFSAKTKSTADIIVPGITTELQLSSLENVRPELCNTEGILDFVFMNTGNNNIQHVVNYRYFSSKKELYIKLYKPLPEGVAIKQKFWISLQVRQPYTDNAVLYKKPIEQPTSTMKGPNFEIDTKYGAITETNYQTWNDLLGSNISTSQQIIDKMFSGSLAGATLGIDYSGFQNFINFSSAKERLSNFKYKVELLEYYNTQITTLNAISESTEINSNIALYRKYKDNVVGGFDGFEQYLYKEQTGSIYTHGVSGSAIFEDKFTVQPWPKVQYSLTSSADGFHPASQYKLHDSTNVEVTTWYSGLLLSASLWDVHNDSSLIKSVPEHIREDANNSEFELFVNMIGHHYDIMWTYINHQTNVWNRDEHSVHGLSKDLLYETAKSMGWHLVNGNQSERLFEYLLGTNELGDFGNINERKIDEDLVLYVPFEEGRPDFASKNFVDYSQANNRLEAYNKPAFVDGAHGHGAEFYGDHYLKYNSVHDYGTADYAVSFWIKDITWPTSGASRIFSSISGSGPDAGWEVRVVQDASPRIDLIQYYTGSNGQHSVTIGTLQSDIISSSFLDSTSPQGISTGGKSNGWHHIAFNVDRTGNMTSYFNNVLKSTVDISVSASADIGPEEIGDYPKPIIGAADTNNTGIPFAGLSGSLDEFRVYKRLLTTSDIADLYNDRGIYKTQSSATNFATPKEDLTNQVWRRIVNNLPHLLKTKGTGRSVKALLSCYGIPSSLLSIREYGGPKMPNSTPALIQDQFSYALTFESASISTGDDHNTSPHIRYANRDYTTNIGTWGFQRNGLSSGDDIPSQTKEFRFKPGTKANMLLLSSTQNMSADNDERVRFQLAVEYTGSYSGSSDYGRLVYSHVRGGLAAGNNPGTGSTDWVPLYDGNFWNVRWFWTSEELVASNQYNRSANTSTTYHIQTQQASDYVTGQIVHSASVSYKPVNSSHGQAWGMQTNDPHALRTYIGGFNGRGSNRDNLNVNLWLNRWLSNDDSVSGNAGKNVGCMTFSGSMQEYREWLEDIGQKQFDMHTLNPKSYVSSLSPSSSYDTLVRHYPLGTNQVSFDHSYTGSLIISSSHPAQTVLDMQTPYGTSDLELVNSGSSYAAMSNWLTPTDTVNDDHYERVDETYYIHGPSIGGKNLKSEKIRIENNKLVHPLNRETRGEVSQYDKAANDSNRLGVFFSPQDMINKDIFNQIGDVALDDYFGSAEYQYTDNYPRYKRFAHQYWKKYENDNDINSYIRIFSLFDFSFFTQLKQLIPIRTNADTGLIIEPSILERSKVVIESEPVLEHIPLEDFIPDPFPDPDMHPVPQEAVIEKIDPINATTLPISASIDKPSELDGDWLELHDTIEDPYKAAGDTSTQEGIITKRVLTTATINDYSASINTKSQVIKESILIPVATLNSGSIETSDHSDAGLDIFGITNGYRGAQYKHISLLFSKTLGWISQSLHPSIVSPTGSQIMDQRPSNHYKKKEFTYFPKDKAKRIYQLDKLSDGQIIDSSTTQARATSFVQMAAGSSTVADWTATKTFELVTHNHFTGTLMEFDTFANMSTAARGFTGVVVPRMTPAPGPSGQNDTSGKPWSISFLMREIPEATGKTMYVFGNSHVSPLLGIGSNNTLLLRDASNTFWYANPESGNFTTGTNVVVDRSEVAHYAVTYEPIPGNSGSVRFYQNGELVGGHDNTRIGTTNSHMSGSFYFSQIGSGYRSNTNAHGFSGSLGCVRYYDYKLPHHEIKHLNRHPEHRANRDTNETPLGGIETTLRRVRSCGYAPFTNLSIWATSHSLIPADYRDDHADSSYYEGSKLTAPAVNEPSEDDVEGGPIVKITTRNRYNLVYKKNLPSGANIAIR